MTEGSKHRITRPVRMGVPQSLVALVAATLLATVCASSQSRPLLHRPTHAERLAEVRTLEGAGRFNETRLLVKFQPGATEADKERVMRALGADTRRRLSRGRMRGMRGELYAVPMKSHWSVSSGMAQVASDPAVEEVHPDWTLQLQDEPSNDAGFTQQWNLQSATTPRANPYGVGVAALWQAGYSCTSTQPVVVAVLDSGVRTTHEDLRDNIFVNPGEIAGNGVDNDGNGFIDDVKGWNFSGNTNNTEDDSSHGTHVAGIIAAKRNNGLGVAGICGDGAVKILPMKVCNGSCSVSSVFDALSYVTDLKKNRAVNIVAVNLSLGAYMSTPSTLGIEYFQAARDAGIMVAAAAGNNGKNSDNGFMWPADLDVDNILSVGSMGHTGQLASSSNYGINSVDIAAPGDSIYSTVNASDSAYKLKSGTSMAAPHVAGAIALYRVLHPNAGVQETRQYLLSTAAVVPALDGKIAGSRLLDVSKWDWKRVGTTYKMTCGVDLTRRAGFWLNVGAFTDATFRAPVRYMGIHMQAIDLSGNVLGRYDGSTNNNGYVLWKYNRAVSSSGTDFTVLVETDDGASRRYTSTQLNCSR